MVILGGGGEVKVDIYGSFLFLGAIWKLGPVLNFTDLMIGLVAIPNLIAILLLSPKATQLTKKYMAKIPMWDKN
ncbi:alanine:cation symporter family protein [Elusimicrobiota bacterium]